MTEGIRQGDIPGVQLRVRQDLELSPFEAWQWLVEKARLEQWLASRVEVEVGPRGSLSLESVAGEGQEALREHGTTREFQPPRRWVLAFRRLEAGWETSTRLTLEIAAAPGGSEVSVFQQGFHQLPLSESLSIWEAYRRRWRRALGRLAEATAQVRRA